MGKFKISISFDPKFLNSLVHTDKSRVEIQRKTHHLALHPIHLNNISESIKDLLKEGVAKYSKDLNGVLLGYQNIKLLSGGGFFHDDTCYTHCDVEADFFVFKPEIDEEMKGVVVRKSKDHVALLVYSTFNVSIPAPRDRDDWLGNSVQMGYEVLFKIVHFSFTSYLPYIKGELISILSEGDTEINHETYEDKQFNKKKKNKRINFNDDSVSQELSSKASESHEASPKKKKSKRNKSLGSGMEVSVLETELKDSEEEPLSPSKKKEKRTKRVKLETSELVSDFENSLDVSPNKKAKKRKNSVSENHELVGDFENLLDVSESKSKKTKKRKLSIADSSETPKKKKKRDSFEKL